MSRRTSNRCSEKDWPSWDRPSPVGSRSLMDPLKRSSRCRPNSSSPTSSTRPTKTRASLSTVRSSRCSTSRPTWSTRSWGRRTRCCGCSSTAGSTSTRSPRKMRRRRPKTRTTSGRRSRPGWWRPASLWKSPTRTGNQRWPPPACPKAWTGSVWLRWPSPVAGGERRPCRQLSRHWAAGSQQRLPSPTKQCATRSNWATRSTKRRWASAPTIGPSTRISGINCPGTRTGGGTPLSLRPMPSSSSLPRWSGRWGCCPTCTPLAISCRRSRPWRWPRRCASSPRRRRSTRSRFSTSPSSSIRPLSSPRMNLTLSSSSNNYNPFLSKLQIQLFLLPFSDYSGYIPFTFFDGIAQQNTNLLLNSQKSTQLHK